MPGNPPPRSVAEKLRATGPFVPTAKLDPSQVADLRTPASPMTYTKWEDGSAGWSTDRHPGGLRDMTPWPPVGGARGPLPPPPIPRRGAPPPRSKPIDKQNPRQGGGRSR